MATKLKMNKRIKARWVAALRSGKFKQGRKQLVTSLGVGDPSPKFCCLGVLATLVDPKKITWSNSDSFFADEDNQCKLLGRGGLGGVDVNSLANLNDGDETKSNDSRPARSFKWIASYIERYA